MLKPMNSHEMPVKERYLVILNARGVSMCNGTCNCPQHGNT